MAGVSSLQSVKLAKEDNSKKCVICQKDKKKEKLMTTSNGRTKTIAAATILEDENVLRLSKTFYAGYVKRGNRVSVSGDSHEDATSNSRQPEEVKDNRITSPKTRSASAIVKSPQN